MIGVGGVDALGPGITGVGGAWRGGGVSVRVFGAGFGIGTAWANAGDNMSDAVIVAANAATGIFTAKSPRVRDWQNGWLLERYVNGPSCPGCLSIFRSG
jgi:L-aminopeptidase/D-esterase-like protein